MVEQEPAASVSGQSPGFVSGYSLALLQPTGAKGVGGERAHGFVSLASPDHPTQSVQSLDMLSLLPGGPVIALDRKQLGLGKQLPMLGEPGCGRRRSVVPSARLSNSLETTGCPTNGDLSTTWYLPHCPTHKGLWAR